jgi:hypothetical protein
MRTVVHEFSELVVRRLRGEQNELRMKLGKGGCRDHAEYSEICGQIEGLDRAQGHIATVLQSVNVEEDKDLGNE